MKKIKVLQRAAALLLCCTLILPLAACSGRKSTPTFNTGESSQPSTVIADLGASLDETVDVNYSRATVPAGVCISVSDLDLTDAKTAAESAAKLIAKAEKLGLNSILLDVSDLNGDFFKQSSKPLPLFASADPLTEILKTVRDHGMFVYLGYDLLREGTRSSQRKEDVAQIKAELLSLVKSYDIDGILLSGFAQYSTDYSQYIASGGAEGAANYEKMCLDAMMREVSVALRTARPSIYLGLLLVSSANQAKNPIEWLQKGYASFAVLQYSATTASSPSFAQMNEEWKTALQGIEIESYTLHDAQQESREELAKQLNILHEANCDGSFFTPAKLFLEDKSGATNAAVSILNSITKNELSADSLVFTKPTRASVTTYESSISLSGSSNPNFPLYLDGKEVPRSELGFFSIRAELKLGENVFTFTHRGKTVTRTVIYKMLLVKDVSPSKDLTMDGGTSLSVSVIARKNATVNATLGTQTVKLTAVLSNDDHLNDGTVTNFCTYSGSFTLPESTEKAVSLGRISVKVECQGQTSSASGGKITIAAKEPEPEYSKTPVLDFGALELGKSGYIVETKRTQLETFEGKLNDNRSRPTNAYLPKGTLDYCSKAESVITSGSNVYRYRLMDYGKRVYSSTKVSGRGDSNDYINLYYGRLPSHNELSAAGYDNNGRHSYLVLDTLWKAPFDVTLVGQEYNKPYASTPDYTVSSLTFTAVEFKFAYCTVASGSFELTNDPLFSDARWIKNSDGTHSLRLTLRKMGGLYGWGASYNEKGQLVLSFLNPYQLQEAKEGESVSLKGAVIMIDPGHGGSDFGSPGIATSAQYYEDELNLILAKKVQSRLEAMGATVIMTRTTDVEVTLNARNELVWKYKPNLFISFHRNGSESATASGYSCFYYEPYSMPLAKEIATRCTALLPGNRSKLLNYAPPMQVCRVSDCPSILTENWFMTNSKDFSKIVTDEFNDLTADTTVEGILAYFRSMQ